MSQSQSKGQQALIESMNANQRAIDTQIPCGKSFAQLLKMKEFGL